MTDPAQRAESVKTAPDGTHRQTNGHGDSMTDPAQRAKSVKKVTIMSRK